MKHKNLFLSLTFKIIICINKFLSYFSLAFFSSSPHLTTTITIFFSAIEEGMLNLKLHCKRRCKRRRIKRRRFFVTNQEDSYKDDKVY
ncbi:hypothetical protein LINPERHAP2_LOCUS9869 [Linum perenne]